VDQTGRSGDYDFTLEFTPQPKGSPDSRETALQEATIDSRDRSHQSFKIFSRPHAHVNKHLNPIAHLISVPLQERIHNALVLLSNQGEGHIHRPILTAISCAGNVD
jgi:hypothetical protein